MLAKHPQVDPPSVASSPVPSVHSMDEAEVLRTLKSFPNGTAPGPSGLRANHLKEAILCLSPDRASRALRALTGLVNALCSGQASMEVIPHLCGGNLLASKKKEMVCVQLPLGRLSIDWYLNVFLGSADNSP